MREIKFKARDKETGVMYDVAGIHWGINVLEFYDEELDSGTYDLDKYDLLEYTGLKDKNGTEIYEDNIVSYANKYITVYMKVVFVNGAFLQTGPKMEPDIWYDWDEVEVMVITPTNLELILDNEIK